MTDQVSEVRERYLASLQADGLSELDATTGAHAAAA